MEKEKGGCETMESTKVLAPTKVCMMNFGE